MAVTPGSLLLDHSSEILLAVDPATLEIVAANQRAGQMLGYETSELLGRQITEIESTLADVFYWEDVRQGGIGEVEDMEGLYACADGSMLPVVKTARRATAGDRELLLLRVRDERGLKRAEANLAELTAQLQATLESISDGILVTDIEGRIVNMNRRFAMMWEIPESILLEDSDVVGNWLASQLTDGSTHATAIDAADVDGHGESIGMLELKNGRVFERRSRPQTEHDRVIGRVFSFHDIAEHILSWRQMAIARERAEVANRTKSEFLAMMSHEIRTPLNGVLGMTALLLDTQLDRDQRQLGETIRSSATALLTIINDILDFSKIEAHKLALERIDFNLASLMEDFSDLYALRAAEKRLDFAWSLAPDTPVRLCGDPGRLRQILTNLVGNALKFTAHGGIAIGIEPCGMGLDAVELRFTVTDTGIGIPPSRLDAIFNPFEQADASTTRRYGGTGLGLAISAQLAEMMEGAIGVDSTEGSGSTFWFTVRMLKQRPEADEPLLPGEDRLRELAGSRVLVVDESEHNRRLLDDILGRWGFDVTAVANAETALAELGAATEAGQPLRVALIDQTLHDLDGETLGRRIRERPEFAGTRLVLMTRLGQRGDAQRMAEIGFAGYLSKPIKRSLLIDSLLAVLGDAHGHVPLVTKHAIAEARRAEARLLVAEDNRINQNVMLALLKKLGFTRIDLAQDGEEALIKATQNVYDLILMDCLMPNRDGYEATRELRRRGLTLPIVAITANVSDEDVEECIAAGMNGHLHKPISHEALAEAMNRWLPAVGDGEDASIA